MRKLIAILLLTIGGSLFAAEYNVAGRILQISTFPNPVTADYPDCVYTMEVEVQKVYSDSDFASRLIVVLPAFADRKLSEQTGYKVNDLVLFKLADYDENSSGMDMAEMADDIANFTLERFWSEESKKTAIIPPNGKEPLDLLPKFDISETPLNPPLSEASRQDRQKRIAEDLKRVNELFELHNPECYQEIQKAYNEALANYSGDTIKSPKNHDFYYWHHGKTFFTLPTNFQFFPDPIAVEKFTLLNNVIIPLKKYLESHNIDFIYVMYPYSYEIAAQNLFPQFKDKYSLNTLNFYRILLENDIEVLDLFPAMNENSGKYQFMYYDHIFDVHPHEGAAKTATAAVAERLKRYNLTPDENSIFSETRMEKRAGWLFDRQNLFNLPDNNMLPQVFLNGDYYITPHFGSEILILGNSFCATPSNNSAAFAELLSLQTGIKCAQLRYGAAGVFELLPKKLLLDEQKFIPGVKVVVMVSSFGIGGHYNIIDKREKLLIFNRLNQIYRMQKTEIIGQNGDFSGALRVVDDENEVGISLAPRRRVDFALNINPDILAADTNSDYIALELSYHSENENDFITVMMQKKSRESLTHKYGSELFFIRKADIVDGQVNVSIYKNSGEEKIFTIKKIVVYY